MKNTTQNRASRLIQYSAATIGAILTQHADGQVAYTDLDPDVDLHYITGDSYLLDINNDGIDDFEISAIVSSTVFTGSSSSSFTSYTYKVLVTPLLDNEVFLTDDANFIEAGETIDADLTAGEFIPSAGDFNAVFFEVPSYIGLKLNTAGAINYGWLRLTNDITSFTLLDYAVELTEDTGIYAQVPGGPHAVSNISTADVSDTHTAADVQVSFTIPDDESGTYSYRIFAGEISFSKMQAINADPEQYTEVFPTGSDQALTLNPGQLDYFHNPVEEFSRIVVGVLSVSADNINESVYQSYIIPVVPGHDVEPVSNVEVTHVVSPYPGTSIEVNFTTPDDLHGIINFLSYIVPADMLPIIDSSLIYINPNHAVLNAWEVGGGEFATDHSYEMPFTGYDINGDVLTFGGQYGVCIQSHTQWPEYSGFAFESLTCSDTFTITDETIGISTMLSGELSANVVPSGIYLHAPQMMEAVELLGINGSLIYASSIHADNTIIPLPEASGIYFVKARFKDGFGIKKLNVVIK